MFYWIVVFEIECFRLVVIISFVYDLRIKVSLGCFDQQVVQDNACSNPAGDSSFVVRVFDADTQPAEAAPTPLQHAVGVLDQDTRVSAFVIVVFLNNQPRQLDVRFDLTLLLRDWLPHDFSRTAGHRSFVGCTQSLPGGTDLE